MWVGAAFEELKSPNYDNMRRRCFEKTGCLLTIDGSNDNLVQPEGLIGYQVLPPLPMPGPNTEAEFQVPEPAMEPLDVIPDDTDDIFTTNDDNEASTSDLEAEIDESDRIGKSNFLFKTATRWQAAQSKFFLNEHL